jgi:hypothetical protein
MNKTYLLIFLMICAVLRQNKKNYFQKVENLTRLRVHVLFDDLTLIHYTQTVITLTQ